MITQRDELTATLLQLPTRIQVAEQRLLHAATVAHSAREALKDAEAAAVLGPHVDGKNEGQRQAQVRLMTEGFRREVDRTAQALGAAKIERDKLVNELSAYRAVARLLGGGE